MLVSAGGHDGTERWGVSELIDLEAQLFLDRARTEQELLRRDVAIGRGATGRGQTALLATWVEAIRREHKPALPGRALERAYRQGNGLLILASFVIGLGSASAMLRFSGEHPINVLVVLGIFVLGQLLAVVLTIVAFALASRNPAVFENRPLTVLVRSGVAWLWRRGRERFSERDFREALNWMRGRRPLYARVERLLVFGSLQRAAVAFNLGVLVAFMIFVTFTDLAFGWSTTLRVGAEELYRTCKSLAAPWAAWLEEATVSMELVRGTQYSRLEGGYLEHVGGGAVDLSIYGDWWRFLVASIVAYGLAPRVVLLAGGGWLVRSALKEVPPRTPEVERLLVRLSGEAIQVRHRDDPGNVSPLGRGYDPVQRPPRRFEERHGLCTRWRDADFDGRALEMFLLERYGLEIEGEIGSAGGHDYESDQRFLARVARSDSPVFVVAEPWEAPDRAFQRFVTQLRGSVGNDRAVIVILTECDASESFAIWAGYLAEMADPYLALDPTAMTPVGERS